MAGLSDPALHLVSLEPDGEWLLAQSESGQPLYIHLPTGTAYPFDLDGSRAALLVRRPQPEEIEPPIPQALPEASPTPGLPASLESFDLLGQAGGNLSAVALDGEQAGIYVLGLR